MPPTDICSTIRFLAEKLRGGTLDNRFDNAPSPLEAKSLCMGIGYMYEENHKKLKV